MMNSRIKGTSKQIIFETDIKVSHYLFLLFWISKPFYYYASGNIQPSDAIFLLSFFAWLIESRGSVSLDKGNYFFAIFVGFVFLINCIYSFIYHDIVFIEKSMFYLYNLFVIISFQNFARSRHFLRLLFYATIFNIAVQLFVFVFGLGGRMYGGVRYMGTFNDPNQFSFFLFSSFLLIYVLLYILKGKMDSYEKLGVLSVFIAVVFLIFQGSSTGAFLGVVAFIFALILSFATRNKSPARMIVRFITYVLMTIFTVFFISMVLYPEVLEGVSSNGSFLIQRVLRKIGRFSSGGLFSIAEERQVSRVFFFPLNLLYGAGEGLHGRFTHTEAEIHSTPFALLFYYGLIPLLFLSVWIKNKLTGLPRSLYPVFIGLFFETFILANQRQPIFWILFILADTISTEINTKKEYGLVRKL